MGGDKKPTEVRSKFTPTGNEQGGADVQPGGHREQENEGAGAREQLEKEEQLGSGDANTEDDPAVDEHEGHAKEDAPGMFSALVGDGKEP